MATEAPQTEIASYLAQSLHKRSLNAIQISWDHQRPDVDRAKVGLKELGDTLLHIQNLHIYDQHKQISNDCLDDWLWRFKDFFYATENLLDDLEFIEWQVFNVPAYLHSMVLLDELIELIDLAGGLFLEIKHFKVELETLKPVCSSLDQQIHTSSELPTLPYKVRESKGRAEEKAKILGALLRKAEGESKDSPVLISITGPAGIGKTDLARDVYNSAQVEAEFDVRTWIYMGNDRRDDNWLTLQRSESVSVHQQSKIHRTSGSSLVNRILETKKTEIKGKKVLIVLDNLTEGYLHDDLFKYGAKVGSRIIVTSQFRYAGKSDDLVFDVELDGLKEEEYLELFKECALGDRNRNEHPELEEIVGEIAKRYGGNPLAAVMIGRLLKSQPDDHWRIISRSNLGTIDPTESNILSALRRSYEQLPGYQKQCYLACALFPKNYPFQRGQLLRIWNAIGFGSNDSFDVLTERSFFVSSDRKHGKFVLHATLHELADRICDGEFFRLEEEIQKEDDIEISDKAQHVYVTADNFVKVGQVLQKKTRLRSLVIDGNLSSEEHEINFIELLEEVLLNLKDLRLLILSVLPTGKLPNAIGLLRHLRHLELPGESIQELPTWLSRGFRHLYATNDELLKDPSSVPELPTQKSTESKANTRPSVQARLMRFGFIFLMEGLSNRFSPFLNSRME